VYQFNKLNYNAHWVLLLHKYNYAKVLFLLLPQLQSALANVIVKEELLYNLFQYHGHFILLAIKNIAQVI
jgi:hypothetical protein